MAGSFWDETNGKQKIHWLDWDLLCLLKLDGGLGLRDMIWRVLTLLWLQVMWWRILQNPNSLDHNVFEQKYFLNSDARMASFKTNSSYVCGSLMEGKL